MTLHAELWTPGQPLGNLSAERVKEIQGIYTGPLVAVLDENGGVQIIQPMDPDTGEDWESEEAALAFAERYMAPPPPEEELPPAE
jgi:hypothetical protein